MSSLHGFLLQDVRLELQSKSPAAVQPHLGKCFDGIRRLEFGGEDPKAPDILAMVSAEGEKVPLGKNLKVRHECSRVSSAGVF